MTKLHTRIIAGPCVTPIINGDVARVLMLPDGAGRIEVWKRGTGWIEAAPGSITLYELMPGKCRPVLEKDAARLGCRLEDFGRHWTEEPKEDKPPEDLTAKRLREAMDLGVKMAEEEALWKLTMKARQVRAAEIERRRPHLVNTTVH